MTRPCSIDLVERAVLRPYDNLSGLRAKTQKQQVAKRFRLGVPVPIRLSFESKRNRASPSVTHSTIMGNIFGSCVQKSDAEQAPPAAEAEAGAVEETTPAVEEGGEPTAEEPKAAEDAALDEAIVSEDAVDVKLSDEQEPAKSEEAADSNQADANQAEAGAEAADAGGEGSSEE